MSQSVIHLTIPTTSYTTIIEPIIGGYKVKFYWYPNNMAEWTLNPCVSYPNVVSTPNGSGGSDITITFDNGEMQSNQADSTLSPLKRTASSKG